MRTPTWAEVEDFLRADRWEEVRTTGHAFFRKTLADGRVLQTHRSFSSNKTMSLGRFRSILRVQLQCSPEAFWDAVKTGRPVGRPSNTPAPDRAHPLWAVRVLREWLHMPADEILALPPEEVVRQAHELWSGGQSEP